MTFRSSPAGTVLKLIDEGYEGILITVSDDAMAGDGIGHGEVAARNETDTREVARRLGLKEAIFLNYPNHNLDAWPIVEMRARLVFLFRYFKVDTVLVYDPSGLYERNPDHYVTARAVEWAAGICAMKWDYPEFGLAGVKPHPVSERYYFSRGPQLVNRVVDISDYIDQKVWVNLANVTQGPSGNTGEELRKKLAAQGKRLPLLGGDAETANRQYTKYFALSRDRARGAAHNLAWAEYFHYIGPEGAGGTSTSRRTPFRCNVEPRPSRPLYFRSDCGKHPSTIRDSAGTQAQSEPHHGKGNHR